MIPLYRDAGVFLPWESYREPEARCCPPCWNLRVDNRVENREQR